MKLLAFISLFAALGIGDLAFVGNASTVLNIKADLTENSVVLPWDFTGPAGFSPVTISVWGGAAPYTYAWTKVSGDTLTPVGGENTYIEGYTTFNYYASAVYRCTVTDRRGNTISQDITYTCTQEPPP